jgi:hypothetical protein
VTYWCFQANNCSDVGDSLFIEAEYLRTSGNVMNTSGKVVDYTLQNIIVAFYRCKNVGLNAKFAGEDTLIDLSLR